MPAPSLRYAVIGAGGISATHLKAIATQPGVELVGISDPADPAQWRLSAAYAGAPRFQDPEKLLRETRPDLVSICTPNKFHCELTLLALKHGAHVACEKPMAMTLAEAGQMESARAAAGKLGGINFSYRNVAAFRFARELVARGELGKLLNHIASELRILRGIAYGMYRAMYWAKMNGIFRSLNPWATWRNEDTRIANDVINNAKYLKQ